MVAYVHRNGIANPGDEGESDAEKTPDSGKKPGKDESKAVQAEQGRAPRLDLPKMAAEQMLDPNTPEFLQELDRRVRELNARMPK